MISNIQSLVQMFKENRRDCRVLVIGDVMLDKYYFGDITRISPEAPVPVINMKMENKTLGGAANVAKNLALLGCKVSLVGVVGKDQGQQELLQMLEHEKIDGSGLLTSERCTTTKTRIISGNQQLLRIDHEDKFEIMDSLVEQFEKWYLQRIEMETFHAIIISDYEKGFCRKELCETVISIANQRGIPVIVDPKGHDWSKYTNATIITPNFKEFSRIIGSELSNTEEVIAKFAPMLREKYSLNYLLITRSEKGMSLVEEGDMIHISTKAKEIYDVSGAGDTVVSTIAAFISIGAPLVDAVKIANIAAGIVVGKRGTYAVRSDELLEELEDLTPLENLDTKVMAREELKHRVNQWRSQGEKIVFTNGCFDLLHIGHAKYLKDARQLGNRLIVGLNSDFSVKRLKGPSRPIVSESDRARMLSFFEFVDAVCIFEEDTPLELISEVLPDILVKGGDYKADEVVGKEYSGRVEIITFVDGYSTTNIIEKISNFESAKV
ncbi:bifunctional D-glycero-beta-D-manno-heptose-7-phosphate kinase/D-glycero-beta-D-manno-heptose 1-phosphate adenylyltransferase HldE [Bacillus luteolus]|uniref:Bifunctional protein HldE n=1 Tax=Litchfieldia luteola TaxID=682179 RepID=A0ABR9QFE6_9BACI|nr:bifunctional D-glycero-beta-D-manno-heptose-7-phosphate kinase/D-glycero-beta-D-manno-heptose 1-phosphate adenylyltransferase HldE [Cytobacillus luteolus]MBE4907217.1 bifunctional D-glycero-beta-D-manno-heptose-7-phosphate kinase/D-glycero-beta-D-manno-heptose 1-phosphate adenylyltransferase HldE [Cytobacillus luteolus]MBP1943307.1 D-beta-D-heptose 7-phosphate kinase/D-beta-D-heptose 1-phosphate adenosyltransferase [Cytobacillus luteolus]